jgi:hypothetical protein
MSETLAGVSGTGTPTWPADVIHVNEDGWVLVNRGRKHGIVPGLRLLVVGQGIRELRDLYAQADDSASYQPALRIRRTYEQLEVIHVEDRSAIAIATRTPPARRPSVYQGPDGELLVWVPLPEGFTWPHPSADDGHDDDASDTPTDDATDITTDDIDGDTDAQADADATGETADEPPELGEQDDERWEEALPLNGVNVGDIVLPAIPVAGAPTSPTTATGSSAEPHPNNPFESGRTYDWMKPAQ